MLRVVLGSSDVSDRDLLARFVASRDEDAFAEIVRRHGAMVLAACRRVTGRTHDAEDAFQAAFLVLARRAAHLSRPELLANWLYGVACRTALEARAARRRAEEHAVPAAPEPAAPPAPDDTAELRRVIDEELAKLPDKYRTAVVLCDLEGLPRAAAATQLGIPEGTLSSRLAHARKVLAERLTRRGVTASATAVAAALGRDVMAVAVPYTLTHLTVYAAVRFAPGALPLVVSPAVSSLTDGVLKTMFATRLRHLFGIGLLACGVIGVGAALAQQLGGPAPPDPDAPPAAGFNPLGLPAADVQQPKPPEAKKIVAKGIEDDDVPYGTFPAQAVVRIEEGKLIVRQRVSRVVSVPVQNIPGEPVVAWQRKSVVQATTHDPADVAVFDMKGNRLAQKAWKELLKSDVHALVTGDTKLPNPRELTLFKPDTLLIVLPLPVQAAPVQAAPAYAYPPAPALPGPVPNIEGTFNNIPAGPAVRPGGTLLPPPPAPGLPPATRPAPALPAPAAPSTPVPPSPVVPAEGLPPVESPSAPM